MALFRSLLDGLHGELERHRNRRFMEATMAACALISAADGEVSFSERSRVDEVLEGLKRLRFFDVHEEIALMNDHLAAIAENPEKGTAECLRRIAQAKDDPGAARTIVKVCMAVSGADGTVDSSERAAIDRVCGVLGLDPSEFAG